MESALGIYRRLILPFAYSFSLLYLFFNIYWFCVCVCMCHDIHVEGRGHFFMSNFSVFTMWNPGLELVLSGLMTSSLIHRAVSLSLSHSFTHGNQTQSLTQLGEYSIELCIPSFIFVCFWGMLSLTYCVAKADLKLSGPPASVCLRLCVHHWTQLAYICYLFFLLFLFRTGASI